MHQQEFMDKAKEGLHFDKPDEVNETLWNTLNDCIAPDALIKPKMWSIQKVLKSL